MKMGHSGSIEPGACAGGFTEAAVVLQISKKIAAMLEKAGHEVLLTRIDDVDNEFLTWRVEKEKDFCADIFVCIHCNACDKAEANGTEVFYYPGSEKGQLLAGCIKQALVANCQTADRGIKIMTSGPYCRLRTVRSYWWSWHSYPTTRNVAPAG